MRSTLDVGGLLDTVAPALARLAAARPEPTARLWLADSARAEPGSRGPTAIAPDADTLRAGVLRRALEEWGVRCRERAGLTALEAFGVASIRGIEVVVARDLTARDRALAYARCLVRLALRDERLFATWFHYRAGHVPAHLTAVERRTLAVVDAIARALLAGRLEAAPRYLLPLEAGDEPPGACGIIGDCWRALLGGLHRASSALYWRSDSYQALRATTPMVRLTSRVHDLLSAGGNRRAA